MNHTIKAAWITRGGFPAVIIQTPLGHLCGYVQVPVGHPAYGHAGEYDTPLDEINCHGGITFAGYNTNNYPVAEAENGHYWIGFDCGHLGDGRDPDAVRKYLTGADGAAREETVRMLSEGHVWTVDEVTAECESIATQLKDMRR